MNHKRPSLAIRSIVRRILELAQKNRVIRLVELALIYAAAVALCLWVAYQVRFDFNVPGRFRQTLPFVLAISICGKLLGLFAFRQFEGWLIDLQKPDPLRLMTACMVGSIPLAAMAVVFGYPMAAPHGVVLIDFVLCVTVLLALQRGFLHLLSFAFAPHPTSEERVRRVGIVGAGEAGTQLARKLVAEPWLGMQPIAFFDRDCEKLRRVHGIPVVGKPEQIVEFKGKLKLDEIIIAMPSAPESGVNQVLALARGVELECKTVPTLGQLTTGRASISALKPVRIEDLLGRAPVLTKTDAVSELLTERTVLVTGAGGSIGSELCRQILSFNPAELLLVERSEPNLFAIEQELLASRNGTSVVPLVADVTSAMRMSSIFRRFRPEVVFHAAAHKHVPMMEHQPSEAIRNNVLGTALVAELAIEHGVDRFVFVSTDKAVTPSSVMGATKRCAEIYLQSLSTRLQSTKFAAVRFGNVLASSGSVVPIFAKQIAAGGPVTVTHPEVTRFFMTIPEATSLVLEAFAFGNGGEIFMLDMGEPMKILELAEKMIRLSGYRAYEEIKIVFTGLRPGEKLAEVLNYSREQVTPTEHPRISRLVSTVQPYEAVRALINELAAAAEDPDLSADDLKAMLVKAVPEYTPFASDGTEPYRRREAMRQGAVKPLPALSGAA
jgi:FlaA1/EpsC-like NDP-sugar epimerase